MLNQEEVVMIGKMLQSTNIDDCMLAFGILEDLDLREEDYEKEIITILYKGPKGLETPLHPTIETPNRHMWLNARSKILNRYYGRK